MPRRAKKPKKLKLKAPTSKKDELVGKGVAFALFGDREEWLKDPKLTEFSETIDGKEYLMGTIARKDGGGKSTIAYMVEWEHTAVQISRITNISILFSAMQLWTSLKESSPQRRRRQSSVATPETNPVPVRAREALFEFSDEDGEMLESESDEEVEEVSDKDTTDTGPSIHPHNTTASNLEKMSWFLENGGLERTDTRTTRLYENGIRWQQNAKVTPPVNVSTGLQSKLKASALSNFNTPLSSFLSFLPLRFWKLWLYETNRYGKARSKKPFTRISLQEFMIFWGIMIKMTLHPTPGRSYTSVWSTGSRAHHDYGRHMARNRFSFIRGNLHMVNNDQDPKGDAWMSPAGHAALHMGEL